MKTLDKLFTTLIGFFSPLVEFIFNWTQLVLIVFGFIGVFIGPLSISDLGLMPTIGLFVFGFIALFTGLGYGEWELKRKD